MKTELTTEFPNRLLTLSDGRPGLRGALHVEITSPSSAELHSAVSQSSALPGTDQPRTPETVPAAAELAAPSSRTTHQEPGPRPAEIKNQNSKIENPNSAILDFISSDETLDRYDEIIVASGWRLENYLRNPVFQNSHQYGDILFTLGRALITEVRQGAPSGSTLHAPRSTPYLFQRIEFAVDANPMARIAYGLYKSKFLSAVSVGFIPLRWQNADAEAVSGRSADILSAVSQSSALPGVNPSLVLGFDPALGTEAAPVPALVRSPVVSSPVVSGAPVYRRKYLEQELLEVSAVAIPANPSALALALKSGAVEKSDLRETLDLLRAALSHPMGEGRGEGPQFRTPHSELGTGSAPMTPISPIPPISPMLADFLPLARTLRDLLRR
jgi:hypothetical protein